MEKEEKAVMLNPFCDEGFKRIFGDKILLMDFLNSFVDTEASIVDLTYENKELVSEENDRRSIIFDLFCKLDNGKHVIIEMQNKRQDYFVERALFYLSRAITMHEFSTKCSQYERAVWGYRMDDPNLHALVL